MSTDDSNRDSGELGPNWTTGYDSSGAGKLNITTVADDQPMDRNSAWPIQISQHVSMALTGNGEIRAYSSLPNSAGESVGARHQQGAPCAKCGKPFEAGHVAYADLKPGMSGVFQHRDCDDPTLAKVVDQ